MYVIPRAIYLPFGQALIIVRKGLKMLDNQSLAAKMRCMTKQNSLRVYLRLIVYLKPHLKALSVGVIATTAASLLASAFYWALRPILNEGFIARNVRFLHWLPLEIITAIFLMGVLSFIGDYFMALVGRHIVRDLQLEIFRHCTKSDDAGKWVVILVFNAEQIALSTTSVLLTIVKDGVFAAGLLVVMFHNSCDLTLIFLATTPFIVLLIYKTSNIMKALNLKVQEAIGDAGHIVKTIVEDPAQKEIKYAQFAKTTLTVMYCQVWAKVTNTLSTVGSRWIVSFAIAILVFLVTKKHHTISVGTFISMVAAMLSFMHPISAFSRINADLQRGIAGAQSIFTVLEKDSQDPQES